MVYYNIIIDCSITCRRLEAYSAYIRSRITWWSYGSIMFRSINYYVRDRFFDTSVNRIHLNSSMLRRLQDGNKIIKNRGYKQCPLFYVHGDKGV